MRPHKLPHETSDSSYCLLSLSSDELGLLTEQGGLSSAFIRYSNLLRQALLSLFHSEGN